MIAVIVKLNVTEGKGEQFEKAMLALAGQVRAKEESNHLYTLCQNDAGDYIVLELYDDEEALAAHGQSEHFKASGASFKGLMSGPPDIQRLKVVG